MKKLLVLLLLLAGTLGAAFAQESSEEYDDFDDIFSQQAEDIEVEQSAPVITTAPSAPAASSLSITGHFDGARTDIHRGGDPCDLAGVLHLQAVHGFGPVLEFLHLQQSLAIRQESAVAAFYIGDKSSPPRHFAYVSHF